MAFSLDETRRITELRQKALRGEASMNELKEGFRLLRQDREAASVGATKTRAAKAAAKAPVDTASVLEGLKSLGANLKSQTFGG